MKTTNKIGFVLLLLLGVSIQGGFGQTTNSSIYPETGKPCPAFFLRNIKYFAKKEATNTDFKGKWLVLDFWNKACGACIESFPKVNAMQKEFADSVQYMLVGIQDKENQIQPMYTRFREKENLRMSCAFDSTLAKKWDIYAGPFIIVIDPNGVVQAITTNFHSNEMRSFLNGARPHLNKAYRVHEDEPDTLIKVDKKKPFLINNNGGNDTAFLFRSLLSHYDSKQRVLIPEDIDSIDMNGQHSRFLTMGANLYGLLCYAYYGLRKPDTSSHFTPILKMRDSASFINNKNLFCYSLDIPATISSKQRMQQIMQHDLENYFGFSAKIEERKYPVLRLIASEKAKEAIKTKGGKQKMSFVIPKVDWIGTNIPFAFFKHLLDNFNHSDIVDETGITGNIDIEINCVLVNTDDLKKGLQKLGFDLIPGERTRKVLVISDSTTKSNTNNN